MGYYSYSLTSTPQALTGGAGEPPNRQGTLRTMTINNPIASAVTLNFYDSTSSLTTDVAEYDTWEYVSADAYGYYEYGTTPRDAVGTPFWSAATTFTPPTAVPTGTGLPSDVAAEAQDYEAMTGVYTLRKYEGVKTSETTVAADATTNLLPFYTVIVPANSVQYVLEGPWTYVSGIVAVTDNASAVALVAVID